MEEHAASNRYKKLLERLVSDNPNGAEFIGNGLIGGARKRKTKRKATKRKASKKISIMSMPIGGRYKKSKKMSRRPKIGGSKKMSRRSKKMSRKSRKGGAINCKNKKKTIKSINESIRMQKEQIVKYENLIEQLRKNIKDIKSACPTKKYKYSNKPKSTKGKNALIEYNKILKRVKKDNPDIEIAEARKEARMIYDEEKGLTKASGLYYF